MQNSKQTLSTRPPREEEHFMQERLTEAIADQSKLMDELAKQLLLVELAIPGLYAAVLKLVSGTESVANLPNILIYAFICWGLSVICTVASLLPRSYRNISRNNPQSIEDFFNKAAEYKRTCLLVSLLWFMAGLFFIILDVFS